MDSKPVIRKNAVLISEVRQEIGKQLETPLRKCAAIAIIENEYAGKDVEDLSKYYDYGEYLGGYLIDLALKALNASPDDVESWGTGAITGLDGELEHGSAIIHPKFDIPIRERLGGPKAIIPSSEKVAVAGTTIDIPLHYKYALKVRTHYDAMPVRCPDGLRRTK